jgi:hypothetical protein
MSAALKQFYDFPYHSWNDQEDAVRVISVYRVESPEGDGPFQDEAFKNSEDYMDADFAFHANRFPTPWMDENIAGKIRHNDFNYYCGCSSMRQLEDWFAPFWEMLHAYNFRVVVYQVPAEHVIIGKHQVVFKKEHATGKKTLTWAGAYGNIRPII